MRRQKGFTLLETLVAMAILGMVASAFLYAVAHSSRITAYDQQIDIGRTLAEDQIEYVKKAPFAESYSPDPARVDSTHESIKYPNFFVYVQAISAVDRDSMVQKITVTVKYNSKTVSVLEGYKTLR
jgi:prepilin-type N-terminal cleavage/methylation domain-containing protein